MNIIKNGAASIYDIKRRKFLIPFEEGYTGLTPWQPLSDGLWCVYKGKGNYAIWNSNIGKEVFASTGRVLIDPLPKGYDGFEFDYDYYGPTGDKFSHKPEIDVYDTEWKGNSGTSPAFYVNIIGLEDREVEFTITLYNKNGSIYKNSYGESCIFHPDPRKPHSSIMKEVQLSAYATPHIHLRPFSSLTLKAVLTAKDTKTGASIPIKGKNAITNTWTRDW